MADTSKFGKKPPNLFLKNTMTSATISKSLSFKITTHSSSTFSLRPSSSTSQFHSISRVSTSIPLVLRHHKKLSSRRYGVPVIRGIESERVPLDIRNRTMDAVDACGGRVTIGDVVRKTGIDINEAQKALQALAADTHGFLEVSDEGDVVYVFSGDYRLTLAAKSRWIKYEQLLVKAKSDVEYIVRVFFGTSLFASIFLVFAAIIVILLSDDGNCVFNLDLTSFDPFWYSDSSFYSRGRLRDSDDGINFFESIYSFVFGDGDPNQGIEQRRWKLIGQHIASNGGVTTAEELAPYLDVETTQMNDDSYILPVLLRLDGQPVVDEEGNILYQFPSMQRTAFPQNTGKLTYCSWPERVGADNKYFRENQWKFSKTSILTRLKVIGLGVLNLVAVFILGAMLRNMAVTRKGFVTLVSHIFPLIQIYAGLLFIIPFVRQLFILKTNVDIGKRNHAREQRAQALELPDLSLKRKVQSARDMANRTFIGQDRIVYTTGRDLFEQYSKDKNGLTVSDRLS